MLTPLATDIIGHQGLGLHGNLGGGMREVQVRKFFQADLDHLAFPPSAHSNQRREGIRGATKKNGTIALQQEAWCRRKGRTNFPDRNGYCREALRTAYVLDADARERVGIIVKLSN